MTTMLIREYLDARPNGWVDYPPLRIAQLGIKRCTNKTLCEENHNILLPAKPPFHPQQFRTYAIIGNFGDLLKIEFGEKLIAIINKKYAKYVGLKKDFCLIVRGVAHNMVPILNGEIVTS
ncbi:Sialyltransferase-like protein 1, partial [Mucuna pruriens]